MSILSCGSSSKKGFILKNHLVHLLGRPTTQKVRIGGSDTSTQRMHSRVSPIRRHRMLTGCEDTALHPLGCLVAYKFTRGRRHRIHKLSPRTSRKNSSLELSALFAPVQEWDALPREPARSSSKHLCCGRDPSALCEVALLGS